METLEQRVRRVIQEEVRIVRYNPVWPVWFLQEKEHLLDCLPDDLIRRIEHFGSTAVPGMAAKPVVDMLVEVTDLAEVRKRVVPILESQGYEYFWRPTHGDDGLPFYAWFIKRNAWAGTRTHHIHMVEKSFREHWERLLFRDYLIEHPEVALQYAEMKTRLASDFSRDRVAYTSGKADFIDKVTKLARESLQVAAEGRRPETGDSVPPLSRRD